MYTSQHLLRVNHDEWMRYAETRRMIKHAVAAARSASPEPARVTVRRRPFRLGRLVGQG